MKNAAAALPQLTISLQGVIYMFWGYAAVLAPCKAV